MDELERLVKLAVDKWGTVDPSAPSVTLSYIPSRDMWYGSVCRYSARMGEGKRVVAKCVCPSLATCITHLYLALERDV